MKDMEFQKLMVEKLNSKKEFSYQDASIYTVLFDLVKGNDLEDVFMVLHNVVTDLGQRDKLEHMFNSAKKWKWETDKKEK